MWPIDGESFVIIAVTKKDNIQENLYMISIENDLTIFFLLTHVCANNWTIEHSCIYCTELRAFKTYFKLKRWFAVCEMFNFIHFFSAGAHPKKLYPNYYLIHYPKIPPSPEQHLICYLCPRNHLKQHHRHWILTLLNQAAIQTMR